MEPRRALWLRENDCNAVHLSHPVANLGNGAIRSNPLTANQRQPGFASVAEPRLPTASTGNEAGATAGGSGKASMFQDDLWFRAHPLEQTVVERTLGS